MIECKEDVVVWFRQLESYKRIDAMCTLLTSCLSFELRFLGTYLEDLASRDYEGLRSIELRVSNGPNLIQNLATCQQAVPTDQRVRRMMAMYLALIRNVNRKCCNELYKTLELWGRSDCMEKYLGQDELFVQELLLIYIMAKNHPVLAFEQRLKCAETFQMLYEQMVVAIEGGGGGGDTLTTTAGLQQQTGNECAGGSTPSPSPTLQQQVQLQQQHSQGQQTTTTITYQQQQPTLGTHHHGGGGAHHLQQQQIQLSQHHPHHVHQQFLDSSTPGQQHIYGQPQHPQLIQTTTSGGQFQQQAVVGAQQHQAHIQVHPGHQLVAAYPQLIQSVDGLSQVQHQAPQQQPMSISMDQFQTVAAVPQYIENQFMTAASTTASAASAQNLVQWQPAAFRHAAPTIDTSIPPPQIPILPQSSTSSSSSQIISQSSSPTQSRTTSPVRGLATSNSNISKITSKRASRRLSTDQTTPPPQGVEMMANKTYEESSEILRNGYGRQSVGGGGAGGRLGKTYTMQHLPQQQQQQPQYQTAHHLSNFHVHPQYNFLNHQLAHQQQQQHLQQQHTIIPGLAPHGLEYMTYSKTGGHSSAAVLMGGQQPTAGMMMASVGGGGGGAGSDSGSNSNDDCSPSETPTSMLHQGGGGGGGAMMTGGATSALQTRLINTQLKGSGSGSGSSRGGAPGDNQVIYVNSSNVSPNNSSSSGNANNSNSSTINNPSSNNNSNELSGPGMSSSSPVSVISVVNNPYGKGRYAQAQQHMTMHGELMGQDMQTIGADQQQVFAYANNHFVAHHSHHPGLHHHPQSHPHQAAQQQQQQQGHHMLRTTGAPQQIQSPPPQAGMTIIPSLAGGSGAQTQMLNYAVVPQQQVIVGQQGGSYVVTTQPLNSCYNCGSQAHAGLDCRETSMEDATVHANYKLDYKAQTGQEGIVEEEEEEEEEEEQGVDGREGAEQEDGDHGGGEQAVSVVLRTVEGEKERRRRILNEQEIIDVDAIDEILDGHHQHDEVAGESREDDSRLRGGKRIADNIAMATEGGGDGLTHRFNAMALQQQQQQHSGAGVEREGGAGVTYRGGGGAGGNVMSTSGSSQKGGKF